MLEFYDYDFDETNNVLTLYFDLHGYQSFKTNVSFNNVKDVILKLNESGNIDVDLLNSRLMILKKSKKQLWSISRCQK